MPQGLSVKRIVDVTVSFAPVAVPLASFNTLLILGDSNVVDTGEAIRTYNDLAAVADDFGTTAPEYLAAALYFSQVPQPSTLYIGRWARTATSGLLAGGFLSQAQEQMANWTIVTNGGFHISIDASTSTNVTGLNFSAQTNLNGVASIIQTALRAVGTGGFTNAVCVWTGQQFKIFSGTTGTSSAVSYLTAPTAGTDISGQLQMTVALAERNVTGVAAETPVAGVARVDGRGWYGLMFAASVMPVDADRIAVAGYIEGADDKHIYGITSSAANILDPASTADLASQLSLADYLRTFVQYSTANPYSVASAFGRAFTVDFEGSNTTITMMFKKQPGVLPEILTASQDDTLIAKRCNVYVEYNNGVSIFEHGVMSGLAYFDEIHGTDWLANRIQTDIFNVLYQSPKIPQTNPGVHVLVTIAEGGLSQAVRNGLSAPGIWNAAGFGTLNDGDYLPKGWFAFADNVDNQSQADREARIAPLIQIALKLAGAVHRSHVQINVNRVLLAALGLGAIMQTIFGGLFA